MFNTMTLHYEVAIMLSLFFAIKGSKDVTIWLDDILTARIETSPGQLIEEYAVVDKHLLFFSQRTNWYEASVICKHFQGFLANLNTKEKANYVAKIMAYSNIHMEDMWIGGYQESENNWRWSDGSQFSSQNSNNEESFPPWTRHPQRKSEKCLVVDRRTRNHSAIFIDLNCYLPKPFICERPTHGHNKSTNLPPQIIQTNNSTYYLYNNKLKFDDAVAFCGLRNYRLAIVLDYDTSQSISRVMLISRPTVETAWIGCHEFGQQWIWVATGRQVDTAHLKKYDYLWAINSFNQGGKCGALDRHLHNYHFIRGYCNKKLPFICEKYSKELIPEKIPTKLSVVKYCRQMRLVLFSEKLNWTEALHHCHRNQFYLGEIREDYVLNCISEMMVEEDVVHLWLAGKYMKKCKKWQWQFSHYDIPTTKGSLVPWCETKQSEHDCLNLDYNLLQDEPEAYGLNCNQKQSFLCMGPRDEWLVDDENQCL